MGLIISTDDAAQAMLNGLTNLIRDRLRERIMERIAPDVENAIEAAVADFKLTIASYREPHNYMETIKVLIEDRRK